MIIQSHYWLIGLFLCQRDTGMNPRGSTFIWRCCVGTQPLAKEPEGCNIRKQMKCTLRSSFIIGALKKHTVLITVSAAAWRLSGKWEMSDCSVKWICELRSVWCGEKLKRWTDLNRVFSLKTDRLYVESYVSTSDWKITFVWINSQPLPNETGVSEGLNLSLRQHRQLCLRSGSI